jgi:hypothetical protein
MTDDDRLRAQCVAIVDAASGGDLGELLGMLDPDVRWYGEDGKLRESGADEVIGTASKRLAAGVFEGMEVERWERAGDRVAVCVRFAPGYGRERRTFVLTLRDGRVIAVEDVGSLDAALARLAGHGVE